MDVASSDVMAALPPQVRFRSFQAGDIDELKRLFALWFPVSYNDAFYQSVLRGKTTATRWPLFSSVATVPCAGGVQCRMCNAGSVAVPRAVGKVPPTARDKHGSAEHSAFEDQGRQGAGESKHEGRDALGEHLVGIVLANLVDLPHNAHAGDRIEESQKLGGRTAMYIMSLGVVTEYRRCGIAKKLVNHVVAHALRFRECTAVFLHVLWTNAGAQRLYLTCGFEHLRHLEGFYVIKRKAAHADLYVLYIHGGKVPVEPALASPWKVAAVLSLALLSGVTIGAAKMLWSASNRP